MLHVYRLKMPQKRFKTNNEKNLRELNESMKNERKSKSIGKL